jgi:dTDP-glucose 4,6-dehydratase
VVPTIIQQCLAGGPIRLGALTPKRDLTYVADTVEGFVRAGEDPGSAVLAMATDGRAYNLGTGASISIGDLAQSIRHLCGSDARIVSERARVRPGASEVGDLVADATRARTTFDWRPRVFLEDGLERTIAWWLTHKDQMGKGRDYAV